MPTATGDHSKPKETVDDHSLALRRGRRVTWLGIAVNLALSALKLLAGVLGRSQALVADAMHSLSDLVTDVIVLVGLRLGRRSPDDGHNFGHGRMETMATFLVGITLVAAALWIGLSAVLAIQAGTTRHPGWLAPLAAAISILAKEIIYQYTVRVGRSIDSSLLLANAWHHRSDALSSVAALLGAGAAVIYPQWSILDAIAALVVSLLIIKVGLEVIIGALRELSDAAPPNHEREHIQQCALGVEGVLGVHDLRVRSVGGLYQAELHVVVAGDISVREGHRIAKEVEACLTRDIKGMNRLIVHVDPE